MTEYTPAPWNIIPMHNSHRETKPAIEASGSMITGALIEPNTEANARLIAAAPELLEALQNLFETYADLVDRNITTDKGHFQQVADAVAKATKES